MGPPDGAFVGERPKIVNYPEIVACGSTSSEEVTNEMEMEGEKNQEQRLRPGNSGKARDCDHQKRAKQTMEKEMMINKEVMSRLAAKESIDNIGDNPEPIQVRRQARQANPKPFAPVLHATFG